MVGRRSGDEQIDRFLEESEQSLTAAEQEFANGPPLKPSGQEAASNGMPRRPAKHTSITAPRWLIAAAAFFLIALVVTVTMLLSQGNRLAGLEKRIGTIESRIDAERNTDTLTSEMQRLRGRVDGLATRINVIADKDRRVKEMGEVVAGLRQEIDALTRSSSAAGGNTTTEGAKTNPETGGDSSWEVNLAALSDDAAVTQLVKRLEDSGAKVRVDMIDKEGDTLQRVVATSFNSYGDAKDFAGRAKKLLNLADDPWISRHE